MTPTRKSSRQQTRKQCELATAFVNSRKLDEFMRLHKNFRPVPKEFLQSLGVVLRDAWDKDKWDGVEETFEQLFADQKAEIIRGMKPGEVRAGLTSRFERAAFTIRLGKGQPVFEPRDVLDEIAYAILRAASLGLLKTCEGKLKGWPCRTPFVVADEGRRRFCYETCGDQAKAEAKKNPKKQHPRRKG